MANQNIIHTRRFSYTPLAAIAFVVACGLWGYVTASPDDHEAREALFRQQAQESELKGMCSWRGFDWDYEKAVMIGNIDLNKEPQLWGPNGVRLVAVKGIPADKVWYAAHPSPVRAHPGFMKPDKYWQSVLDKREVLIPIEEGWTIKQAVAEFLRTGRYCGEWKDHEVAVEHIKEINGLKPNPTMIGEDDPYQLRPREE
jgi:hypothetical protein